MHDKKRKMSKNLSENLDVIQSDFGKTQDVKIRKAFVSKRECAFLLCDGLVNSIQMSELVVNPIMRSESENSDPHLQFCVIRDCVSNAVEQMEVETIDEIELFMMSGFVVFLLDGVDKALVMGSQGWIKRAVMEPTSEAMGKGAKECFIESLNDNVALVRKRLKTPMLRFEPMKIGKDAPTNVALTYIKGKADERIVDEVRKRLQKIPADRVVDYGCIQPFLDTDRLSFFTAVGNTERPDTLCAKLMEGRVAVMVDGTPFVIFVPYLFSENFQSLDDYDNRPYYSTFIRILKYISFVLSLLVPGVYVAVGTFHQELLPATFLYNVASAENKTPLNLMAEAILILFMYEVMREAGLRLPKTFGHAVSIIGGIVIGDAAVNAGLIGAPMLIVVAITAISSYVVYPLYEPVSVLRFFFVIAGGTMGLYGIMILLSVLTVNAAAISPYGVAYTSPDAPFDKRSFVDNIFRFGWKTLYKKPMKVQELKGSDIDEIL